MCGRARSFRTRRISSSTDRQTRTGRTHARKQTRHEGRDVKWRVRTRARRRLLRHLFDPLPLRLPYKYIYIAAAAVPSRTMIKGHDGDGHAERYRRASGSTCARVCLRRRITYAFSRIYTRRASSSLSSSSSGPPSDVMFSLTLCPARAHAHML